MITDDDFATIGLQLLAIGAIPFVVLELVKVARNAWLELSILSGKTP